VDAIDAWLTDHEVEAFACADVYEACVHLLREYENVPDLVLMGADWLAEDELGIVRYVRETWPQAVMVLYGAAAPAGLDLLPLTLTCRTDAGLQELLAKPPAQVVRQLRARATPRSPAAPLPAVAAAPAGPSVVEPPRLRPLKNEPPLPPGSAPTSRPAASPADPDLSASLGGGLKLTAADPPRSILTAEELAALLDLPDES
jgi:hypothetical protein